MQSWSFILFATHSFAHTAEVRVYARVCVCVRVNSTIIHAQQTICHLFDVSPFSLNCRHNYLRNTDICIKRERERDHTFTMSRQYFILSVAQRRFFWPSHISLCMLIVCVCVCAFHAFDMLCILFYNCRILQRIRMQRSRAEHFAIENECDYVFPQLNLSHMSGSFASCFFSNTFSFSYSIHSLESVKQITTNLQLECIYLMIVMFVCLFVYLCVHKILYECEKKHIYIKCSLCRRLKGMR